MLVKSSTYRPNLKPSGGENRTLADAAEPPQQVVVTVLVDAPRHAALSPALSYASERPLAPGTLVRVPFGRREVAGLVWSAAPVETSPTTELKAVAQVCGDVPPLAADWCALVDFAAAYYQRSVGEIALSVLPPELRRLGRDALADRVRRLRKAWANSADRRPARRSPASPYRRAGRRHGRDRRGDRRPRSRHDTAPWRDRQRQDRGLSARG